MKKKLAKIRNAKLNIQDRGILTFWIDVDYEEGCSQGVGGICLDDYDKVKEKRVGTAYGCEVIRKVLEVVGVDDFSEMKGKYIYVIGDGEGLGFTPRGIQALFVDNSKEPKVVWQELLEEFEKEVR